MVESGELGEIFVVNGSYQQDWLRRTITGGLGRSIAETAAQSQI